MKFKKRFFRILRQHEAKIKLTDEDYINMSKEGTRFNKYSYKIRIRNKKIIISVVLKKSIRK